MEEPQQKAPGAQAVADWIRQRIRTGRFVPGQRLIEVDIIRQTGASRARVREALQRLEGEGLVTIEEFRGASVRSTTLDEVRQIYRARMALEGMAMHDFILHASPAARERLRDLQDQLDASVRDRAPDRFARLNTEWHRHIIEGSGNAVIADLVRRLNVPIHRLLFESFYDERRLMTANADHQAMMALIEAGKAAEAEQAMRDHIGAGFVTLTKIEDEFYS